jgi:hypothetical protein
LMATLGVSVAARPLRRLIPVFPACPCSQRRQNLNLEGDFMYTFSPSFTPALRGHIGAQLSFADDLSRSMLSSFEKLCNLNMQAIRALVETASTTRPQLWSDMQANLAAIPAIATKPAIEKIHAYQQNVSRLAVDAQIEMAQVMQEHSTITPLTARTLSDEMVRSPAKRWSAV